MMTEKLSYIIQTIVKEEMKEPVIIEVSRSFSDFDWLQMQLIRRYPGVIIPGLPSKSILAKLNKNIGITI